MRQVLPSRTSRRRVSQSVALPAPSLSHIRFRNPSAASLNPLRESSLRRHGISRSLLRRDVDAGATRPTHPSASLSPAPIFCAPSISISVSHPAKPTTREHPLSLSPPSTPPPRLLVNGRERETIAHSSKARFARESSLDLGAPIGVANTAFFPFVFFSISFSKETNQYFFFFFIQWQFCCVSASRCWFFFQCHSEDPKKNAILDPIFINSRKKKKKKKEWERG